jgi:hypothetical protein
LPSIGSPGIFHSTSKKELILFFKDRIEAFTNQTILISFLCNEAATSIYALVGASDTLQRLITELFMDHTVGEFGQLGYVFQGLYGFRHFGIAWGLKDDLFQPSQKRRLDFSHPPSDENTCGKGAE